MLNLLLGLGLGINNSIIRDFDFAAPRYGLDFTTDTYIGGIQPDNTVQNNSNDGRFFRQQISKTTPLHTMLADGTLRRDSVSMVRISSKGCWCELDIKNEVVYSNDLDVTHILTVTGGSGTFSNGNTVTASSGGGTGTYTTGVGGGSNTFVIRGGTGSFSGTLSNGLGATRTISAEQVVWVKSNVTCVTDQVSPDGVAASATRVTALADNGTVSQSCTASTGSAARMGWIYARRASGSGDIEYAIDGTNFTTLTGIDGTWKRFSTPAVTDSNYTPTLRIATMGDSVDISFTEVNDGTVESTPIFTQTVAKRRQRDRASTSTAAGGLTNPSSGLMDFLNTSTRYGVYVEFASRNVGTTFAVFGFGLYVSSGKVRFSHNSGTTNLDTDEDYLASADFNFSSINKAFAFVDGSAAKLCANGGTIKSGTGFGSMDSDHRDLGTNGAGTTNMNGIITKLKIFDFSGMKYPTDAELLALTS